MPTCGDPRRSLQIFPSFFCVCCSSHSDRIRSIGASAHLNTTFKHLIYFINEFELVTKTEMQPLERLISKFTHSAAEREPGAAASASQ